MLDVLYPIAVTAADSVRTVSDSVRRRLDRVQADARIAAWAKKLFDYADIRLEIHGRERVDWSRAYIVMSNHQSHYDIPVLFQAVPGSMRMVTKAELFRVPLWGRAMREAGFIEIDRGNRQKALDSLRAAAEKINSGINVWIAPEGTRSRDGRLGKLKRGGFLLAVETGTPIVPLAIDGTFGVLAPGSLKLQRGRVVRVTIGAPIPAQSKDVEALRDEVERFFRAHLP